MRRNFKDSAWGNRRPDRKSRGFHRKVRRKGESRNRNACYYLPRDTLSALEISNPSEKFLNTKDVKNLSLLLDKFAPYSKEKGLVNDCHSENPKASGNVLKTLLGEIKVPGEAVSLYKDYFRLYEMFVNSIGAEKEILASRTRLVVGLGDESVYETSIRLLRNYGVPYIPGSALKGITRAWATEMMAELLDGAGGFSGDFYERAGQVQKFLSEGKAGKFPENSEVTPSGEIEEFVNTVGVGNSPRRIAEKLVELFGTTKNRGKAIFLDALPVPPGRGDWHLFEWDIMNPHYGPYYQRGEPPGDWHSPVPVIFLTVKAKTPFLFGVAGEMKETAWELLKLAIENHGVGAKTTLGYGRFNVP
ncbi:type III-B CRISPR module RAMP protein Cmr6 [Thermococcus indicus]|uniref:Type III-B CRISPR module RAMP protein Cmr6 n=1 Tax=Thermococcus indicus TaxID=2586643 RepID=A0A4Y5SLK6_9EURY|nr:type III-B CRISPR module RAMP protein Cmr6 [Thermococcus indicus]QDA31655.1 type III-B CRISPR module RAMP protein Cmr6 [Thermococcus indicus]